MRIYWTNTINNKRLQEGKKQDPKEAEIKEEEVELTGSVGEKRNAASIT